MTTQHSSPVTVVGGGLAGLVAAITAAEHGATVRLLEGHAALGGRARSTPAPFVANDGPHVIYADGATWAWLRARSLHRPARRLPVRASLAIRFRTEGVARALPPRGVLRLLAARNRAAPVDLDFRSWVAAAFGDRTAAQASSAAGVVTFTADPGRLSAAFVWERLLRATNPLGGPRYAGSGWGGLVDRLAGHARALGVEVVCGARVDELPASPVIVATSLPAARPLLARPLETPATGGRTTLLDVGLSVPSGPGAGLFAVSDLDESGWVEQYSWADPALAPDGSALFQAQLPVRDGETGGQARERAERLLDLAAPGWRTRVAWRRDATAAGRSGALDLPGYTWRDRPAVDQGDGIFLAGDEVAAPGVLGEVSVASAVRAGRAAAGLVATRPVPALGRSR